MKYCLYWPAVLIKTPPQLMTRKKKVCVLFLGTKNYGFVDEANIISYVSNRSTLVGKSRSRGFNEAVAKMDEYISDPQKYQGNLKIDPLDDDVEVKEEPESDTENENEQPINLTNNIEYVDAQREELINEL